MELRDYFTLIGKHLTTFIIIVILTTLTAFLFTKLQPTTYTAQTTVTVNRTSALKQNQVDFYLYDNYYNLQATQLFSQIVANWLASPSFVKEVYQKAGVNIPDVSKDQLAKTFKTTLQMPATIVINLDGTSRDELNKLINATPDVLSQEATNLSNSDSTYQITKLSPIIIQNKPNTKLNTAVGLVCGIILGIIAIIGVAYFKREKI